MRRVVIELEVMDWRDVSWEDMEKRTEILNSLGALASSVGERDAEDEHDIVVRASWEIQ